MKNIVSKGNTESKLREKNRINKNKTKKSFENAQKYEKVQYVHGTPS